MNSPRSLVRLGIAAGAVACGGLAGLVVSAGLERVAAARLAQPSVGPENAPVVAGSISAQPAVSADPPKPAAAQTLRLRGSSTIGRGLAPALVRGFLEKRGATDVKVEETTEGATVRATLDGGRVDVVVAAPGTREAFACFSAGTCDVGLASRPIHDDEAARLASIGDFRSAAAEHVLGLDGIAVVVPPGASRREISLADLRRVFHDGSSPYAVHARDEASGTHDAFVELALGGRDLSAKAKLHPSSEALTAAVAADPNAIGFVGFAAVGSTRALAVKVGGARALYPTPFTVASEDYPLSRRLYLYRPPTTATPLAVAFVDYALSPAGQAIVGERGFVGLTPTASPRGPSGAGPAAYRRAVEGAERLSTTVRFRSGGAGVDTRGERDLGRIVAYLAEPARRGKKVRLLGFTDDRGPATANLELSRRRAQEIAEELRARGVEVEGVHGFGRALPVAANDTDDGREKNRRVEVWVR